VCGLERRNWSVLFDVGQLQIELSLRATSAVPVETTTESLRRRDFNARGFAVHPEETVFALSRICSFSRAQADGGSGW
jgi:hypothetical protein